MVRFAVIGINHGHIHGQVACMRRAGAEFVGFFAAEDDLAADFAARHDNVPRVAEQAEIFESDGIDLVLTAAIPAERAAIAAAAMRHGKDVMTDKPGMTTLDDLAELRRVQAETGRIYSVLYSEHFETGSTVRAGQLVADGAIGEVVHTTGLGPHRIGNYPRPGWFYQRHRTGGILADIASHQCEQFLFFTDSLDAEVLSASVANTAHPDHPDFQDVGDLHLRAGHAAGFVRVDWFTPDGLPVWGDGRLVIVGTQGFIELRKYVDIAGRDGGDHLFLVNSKGITHQDCAGVDLPYGRQLVADIRDRTETAMPQARCFAAMRLALEAQRLAERDTRWQR